MPVTFYRTFIRASTDTKFFEDPAEFTQYVYDTYISTNLCLEHRTPNYSEDQLIKTVKSVWVDQAAIDAALLDPIWQENIQQISDYCTLNNILSYFWIE